jgi:O-antigen chain-terminating methyltransferase
MDPTHVKPIPPKLLQFYVSAAGFKHASIMRTNGNVEFSYGYLRKVLSSLFLEGTDYAVIARKLREGQPDQELVEKFVASHTQSTPSDMWMVMEYAAVADTAIARVASIEDELGDLRSRLEKLAAVADTAIARVASIEDELGDLRSRLEKLGDGLSGWLGRIRRRLFPKNTSG